MDSQVGAAWIGVIPTLGALLFVVILVVINRERLAVVLTRITRLAVAGVQVDFAIEDLRNARPEQPVTQRSATLLEARIARNLDAVRGRRVLWVDDDPKGNRAERRLLRSAGIWVENVVTTAEALDRLRRDDYDVVITDQAREGSDTAGEELAKRARELGEHVPFVAYVRKLDDRPTPSVFNGVTNRPDQLVHPLLTSSNAPPRPHDLSRLATTRLRRYGARDRSGNRTTACSAPIRPSAIAAATARKARRVRHHPWTRQTRRGGSARRADSASMNHGRVSRSSTSTATTAARAATTTKAWSASRGSSQALVSATSTPTAATTSSTTTTMTSSPNSASQTTSRPKDSMASPASGNTGTASRSTGLSSWLGWRFHGGRRLAGRRRTCQTCPSGVTTRCSRTASASASRDGESVGHGGQPVQSGPDLADTVIMASFENTVTIGRPVGQVFAFLADFENIPKWNYAIVETRKVTPGPVGVGTAYRQTRSVPRRSEEGFEVTGFEPESRLEVQGTIGPFQARLRYTLEPVAEGTRLTNAVDLKGSGPRGLAARLAASRVKEAVAANLDALKRLLEGT
jgi:uncharacterized protein YndB with AHSA1/START domain